MATKKTGKTAAPPAKKPERPKDITQFIRETFEKNKFSAIEELVKMAIDPPEDMKTSERIAVLKHLSEYEAPKAKSESLIAGNQQNTGIHISVVQYGNQTQVREKLPESAYSEFLPGTDKEAGSDE